MTESLERRIGEQAKEIQALRDKLAWYKETYQSNQEVPGPAPAETDPETTAEATKEPAGEAETAEGTAGQ